MHVIARDLKLSRATVSTILKDKERIRAAVKGSAPMQLTIIMKQQTEPLPAPMQLTIIMKQQTEPLHKMERLLYIYRRSDPKMDTVKPFYSADEG